MWKSVHRVLACRCDVLGLAAKLFDPRFRRHPIDRRIDQIATNLADLRMDDRRTAIDNGVILRKMRQGRKPLRKNMISFRTFWSDALRRILRLEILGVRRAVTDAVRTPSDLATFAIAGFVALLLVAAAVQKILALEHSRYFVLLSAIPGFAAHRGARLAEKRMRWTQEFGVLASDALEPDAARAYVAMVGALATCAIIPPSALFAASLSGSVAPSFILAAVSGAIGLALGVHNPWGWTARLPRASFDRNAAAPFPAAFASSSPAMHTGYQIVTSRRLSPFAAAGAGVVALAAVGLLLGTSSTLLGTGGASTPLAAATALPALFILLWLTRVDVDMTRALNLSGAPPLSAGWTMLRPAWLFSMAYSAPSILGAFHSLSLLAPAAVAIAGCSVLSVLFLMRTWRAGMTSPRAADLMACADVAVIVVSAMLAAWLAPIVAAALLWRLHRQASSRLFAI